MLSLAGRLLRVSVSGAGRLGYGYRCASSEKLALFAVGNSGAKGLRPRDFDPRIHDGDRACLFNIDDLMRIREQTLADRKKHIAPAESIVDQEVKRFLKDTKRRSHGPIIAKLTQEFEARRREIVAQLLAKLNGKLSETDKAYIEGAFRLLQNKFLHGPISALAEEAPEPGSHTLLEALRKLFRLEE